MEWFGRGMVCRVASVSEIRFSFEHFDSVQRQDNPGPALDLADDDTDFDDCRLRCRDKTERFSGRSKGWEEGEATTSFLILKSMKK